MVESIALAFESIFLNLDGWIVFLVGLTGVCLVGSGGLLIWAMAKIHQDRPELKTTLSSIGQNLTWLLVPIGGVYLCNFSIQAENGFDRNSVELDGGQMSSPNSTVQISGLLSGWLLTYSGPDGQLGTLDDIVVTDLSVPALPRELPITKN